ncbi:hypothetical protein CPSG_03282 [Coccidioides posadasii str. Silveira]|uniref:Uncharacterized protein n=1 Tax=Coccidioides posadasii (strain RMSCC 757 / Silveira) TaxID=443226 RepID=E9CZK4_COCPS|nr:hypothetical protein CPSG_03282 [Coccidioides posadasii str. Silveira]
MDCHALKIAHEVQPGKACVLIQRGSLNVEGLAAHYTYKALLPSTLARYSEKWVLLN